MVALLVTLLLGFTLASYLILVRSQHASTVRSQGWHQALVLAESGVEEALAQLNPGVNPTEITTPVPGGNGWILINGFYQLDPPDRTLPGGRYAVVYTPDNPPTIYATGYTKLPAGSVTLSRAVRVTTTNAPLHSSGLSVRQISNPSGHAYSQDSYDSQNPAYSDSGRYSAAKAKSPAVANPPSLARSELPEIQPPYTIGWTLPTKDGNTYSLLSGNYYIDGNLNLPNAERLYIGPGRSATLYVTGDFSMAVDSSVEIAPTGKFRLFIGKRAIIDYINNQGTPHNFQYYGLPGNTNVTLTQITPAIVASIYAPNATFAATQDTSLFNYSGTLVVSNLVLTRPFNFHYDESLGRLGPKRGFVATSWREL